MSSKVLIPFLIAMMLVTGVCNTLLTKYQDNQCVANCDSAKPKLFEQPLIQTAQMFIGEMGCWLVIGVFKLYRRYVSKTTASPETNGYAPVTAEESADNEPAHSQNPSVSPMIAKEEHRLPLEGCKITLLSLPAICDICGTTLMNVGLLFVVASIYQMTRGALVLFVGLFSVLFLKHRLHSFQWFALVTVVVGVGIVGSAGALYKEDKAAPVELSGGELMTKAVGAGLEFVRRAMEKAQADEGGPAVARVMLGVFLIAGAQIFTATQFVLEEFILERYELEPIKVVGWEGLFGFLVTLVGMVVMHLAVGRTAAGQGGYFDLVEGWREITTNKAIGLSSLAIMVSIGGFNFFGLSVTRTVSATSRSTIDTCRTLFIWIVSLGLGWESFKWLQVVGFGLLVYGTFLFNGLIRPPLKRCVVREDVEELLPETPIEHM